MKLLKLTVLAGILVGCAAPPPGEPDDFGDDVDDEGDGGGEGGGGGEEQPPPPDEGQGSGSTGVIGAPTNQPWRVLDVAYEVQTTGYWCGPTATKMALSARMANPPTQQQLANQLPTDTDGTDWIGQVTATLNNRLSAKWYVTKEMPNDPPTQAQRDALWRDLNRAVDNGFAIVANIVAPASNHPPGYPNYTIYHYVTLIGYNRDTQQVYVADSANFGGNQKYWLSFNQVATLIPPKGYTAPAACARDAVVGQILAKFDALGGCASILGAPITSERTTPDGVGRYSVFEKGSIYWTPELGAHEVHGRIRDAWRDAGWESGSLGYPTSDEYVDGDGRRTDFQHGYIHWSAVTNTTTIGQ